MQLIDKVIKRPAQVVICIADHKRKIARKWIHMIRIEIVLEPILMPVYPERDRLVIKSTYLFPDIAKMLGSSAELRDRVV
jgi:hypothetical protein